MSRQSGTISLNIVGAAIAKVQIGTDRTAAELAINRLEREILDWNAYLQGLYCAPANLPSSGELALAFSLVMFLAGLLALLLRSVVGGLLFFCASVGLFYSFLSASKVFHAERDRLTTLRNAEVAEVQKRIDDLNRQLAENRALVRR